MVISIVVVFFCQTFLAIPSFLLPGFATLLKIDLAKHCGQISDWCSGNQILWQKALAYKPIHITVLTSDLSFYPAQSAQWCPHIQWLHQNLLHYFAYYQLLPERKGSRVRENKRGRGRILLPPEWRRQMFRNPTPPPANGLGFPRGDETRALMCPERRHFRRNAKNENFIPERWNSWVKMPTKILCLILEMWYCGLLWPQSAHSCFARII